VLRGEVEELTLFTAITRLVACAALAAVCEDMVSFEGDQRSIDCLWMKNLGGEINLVLFGG
jgi:hypothetical protein